ncbi:MAG: hypothetical protein F6K09_05460 [Merismopedia sp. SIO2A8]|nr:hypothetical protein [Merismopedia sp. SIO2A8]
MTHQRQMMVTKVEMRSHKTDAFYWRTRLAVVKRGKCLTFITVLGLSN